MIDQEIDFIPIKLEAEDIWNFFLNQKVIESLKPK